MFSLTHLTSCQSQSPPAEGTTDPRYPPAAIASHRASVLISLREIADWEGDSQDFSPFLTTVFEAGEYLDLVRNFRVLGIDPFAYINNLDKVGSHPIKSDVLFYENSC